MHPDRRRFLKHGVVAGLLLSGCSAGSVRGDVDDRADDRTPADDAIAGGDPNSAGDDGSGDTEASDGEETLPTNRAPVWLALSAITFRQGLAGSFSVAGLLSDADGDALMLTLNDVVLPEGVTFDAPGKRFVYDGLGAVGTTSGCVLTADDGRG